jgi:threonine/homoserine/homoserine lactone efflux protein
VKLVLGALLLVLGLRNWRARPKAGEPAPLPKWLQAIEAITPAKSVGLGLLLSAANPKNLIMAIGGGLAIAQAPTSNGGMAVAALIFVALAVSTVVVPVILYHSLGARAERILNPLNAWLQANNSAVMAVLFLVIGVVLIGKGISGF